MQTPDFLHVPELLARDARGWLVPTPAYLATFLTRPELAPVEESCPAELALHARLLASADSPVSPAELSALEDVDVRENYAHFLRFRDGLLAAGTLEAYYQSLFSSPVGVTIAPLFVDVLVQAITAALLGPDANPYDRRAADMLYRSQRISVQDGQVLSGDKDVLDMLTETGGLGDFGRFLAEAKAPQPSLTLKVLDDDNAPDYLRQPERHNYLLDLTHEVSNELSHGLVLTLTRARSGLNALARVLQQWVRHFLGVSVTIKPLQKIDDDTWRWHVGLDAEATALLNDLYEGVEVDAERRKRLVSLFRLDFVDPREMRADVAGKPVYLAIMTNAEGVLRIKPQNLLINLPLSPLV